MTSTATMTIPVAHYFRKTSPPHSFLSTLKEELTVLGFQAEAEKIQGVETESCFNVQADAALDAERTKRLEWLLAETFEPEALLLEKSNFPDGAAALTLEFGPRMTFTSAFSSNAVSICQACDLPISRLELSRRYRFDVTNTLSDEATKALKLILHDRMTEEEYPTQLTSFDNGATTVATKTIPVMEQGRAALEEINKEMGLGFDDFDLDYYTNLFKVRVPSWQIPFLSCVVLTFLTCLMLDILGETRSQPYRCRVLRHGPIKF
jgi:phosphoribosylformylglycinamidine synthase